VAVQQLELLLSQQIEAPQWGVFGEPRVNVLLFNLALDQQFPVR
jgi:K+-transporting ATPase ATPase C chain